MDKFSGWATWASTGRAVNVDLTGLSQNTHYYVRLYAQDSKGMYSTGYNSIDFWTNKAPLPPTDQRINGQSEGMSLPVLSSATFGWTHNDEDYADYQSGFQIQYRVSATSSKPAGAWTTVTAYPGTGTNLAPKVAGPPSSSHNEWVFNPGTFSGNSFYEWQVRTRDGQGLWGAWSSLFSFFSSSTNTPPILVAPPHNSPLVIESPYTFVWRFIDPDPGNVQARADIRYRSIGSTKEVTAGVVDTTPPEWITLLGAVAPGVPGSTQAWPMQPHSFVAGYTYEWQVRTYDDGRLAPLGLVGLVPLLTLCPSRGRRRARCRSVRRPDHRARWAAATYRVFVYEQGGQRRLGEITPIDQADLQPGPGRHLRLHGLLQRLLSRLRGVLRRAALLDARTGRVPRRGAGLGGPDHPDHLHGRRGRDRGQGRDGLRLPADHADRATTTPTGWSRRAPPASRTSTWDCSAWSGGPRC